MDDFIPKTAESPEMTDSSETQEDKGFIPIKSKIDAPEQSDGSDTEFQQKRPKPAKPLELPPNSLKGVEVPEEATPSLGESTTSDAPDEPDHQFQVKIIRDGERITKMLVQCKCGETIPLDCIY